MVFIIYYKFIKFKKLKFLKKMSKRLILRYFLNYFFDAKTFFLNTLKINKTNLILYIFLKKNFFKYFFLNKNNFEKKFCANIYKFFWHFLRQFFVRKNNLFNLRRILIGPIF